MAADAAAAAFVNSGWSPTSLCHPSGFAANWANVLGHVKAYAPFFATVRRASLGKHRVFDERTWVTLAPREVNLRQSLQDVLLRVMECMQCCCCCGGSSLPNDMPCGSAMVTFRLFVLAFLAFWERPNWSREEYQWSFEGVGGPEKRFIATARDLALGAHASWWEMSKDLPWDELLVHDWPVFSLLGYVHSTAPPGFWNTIFGGGVGEGGKKGDVVESVDERQATVGGSGLLNEAAALLAVAEWKREKEQRLALSGVVRGTIQLAQQQAMAVVTQSGHDLAAMSACAGELWERLDRMACHGWVPIAVPGTGNASWLGHPRATLHMRVYPFREEISDAVRGTRAFHCSGHFRKRLTALALGAPTPVSIVEVGANFGDCAFWACTALQGLLREFLLIELLNETSALIRETLDRNQELLSSRCPNADLLVSAVGVSDREGDMNATVPTGFMGGALLILGDEIDSADAEKGRTILASAGSSPTSAVGAEAAEAHAALAASHVTAPTDSSVRPRSSIRSTTKTRRSRGASAQTTQRRVRVPVTTLDHELVRRGLSRVDVLKVHTIGHELEVIRGASRLFDGPEAPVAVMIRLTGQTDKAKLIQLTNFLVTRGYLLELDEQVGLPPAEVVARVRGNFAGDLWASRTRSYGVPRR
eukprot:TRINITY_DN75134_c0_g1_i1.p1 TRINITY_DN75134_c0_g1~~TRINITY_DN75134_c0_g1_i1.p1  ORF type:complete len:648 (+),score=108.15 TRINITY_DN75134_c0_g1_i1:105-2048(+)